MLSRIPTNILVPIVLIVGVLGILFLKSPHSPCENQLEAFKNSMVGTLYPKKIRTATRPPRYFDNQRDCKQGNSSGACAAFFEDLRRYESEFRLLVRQCRDSAPEISEANQIAEKAIETFVQLAWASYREQSPTDILGWLGPAEMGLYCRLKQDYIDLLGFEALQDLQSRVISKLSLSRDSCEACQEGGQAILKFDSQELMKRTLFAASCSVYL